MDNLQLPETARKWLENGDKGISSKTMFGAISGLWLDSYKCHPLDPSDFKRCYKLIKEVPEWRSELHKVSALSKQWKAVVDNWDVLSHMLEEQMRTMSDNGMYDFMKSIGC